MARQRIIKPEFWESETVGVLSDAARLLLICIWNHAENCGIAKASPAYWKGLCWSRRSISISRVQKALDELANSHGEGREGTVVYYESNGIRYLRVPDWAVHNTGLRKAGKPSLPLPPGFHLADDDKTLIPDQDGISTVPVPYQDGTSTVPVQEQDGTGTVAVPLTLRTEGRKDGLKASVPSASKKEPSASETARTPRKSSRSPGGKHHQQVIDHVHDTLKAKLDAKPVMPYAAIGKWLKPHLKDRSAEHIMAVWDHWLASDDAWAKKHAWGWSQFVVNFNAVELTLKEGKSYGSDHGRTGGGGRRSEPSPPSDFGAGGTVELPPT